jgi:hypothetical protein
MADTKISALPASTTPLAGTEVLPIVQGGSTKKVSVADLTAGRAVATAGGSFTDNITQSTAGKGVNFTANTNAPGMTSELLNWYEEGTWTPAIRFNGGNTGMSVTASGKYTRVGRQVTVTLSFAFTAKGSSTGQFEARGLPFNAGTAGSGAMGYNLLWATMPTGGVSWTASSDRIYAIAANNGSYMDDTYFANNTIVNDITVTYFV